MSSRVLAPFIAIVLLLVLVAPASAHHWNRPSVNPWVVKMCRPYMHLPAPERPGWCQDL